MNPEQAVFIYGVEIKSEGPCVHQYSRQAQSTFHCAAGTLCRECCLYADHIIHMANLRGWG